MSLYFYSTVFNIGVNGTGCGFNFNHDLIYTGPGADCGLAYDGRRSGHSSVPYLSVVLVTYTGCDGGAGCGLAYDGRRSDHSPFFFCLVLVTVFSTVTAALVAVSSTQLLLRTRPVSGERGAGCGLRYRVWNHRHRFALW